MRDLDILVWSAVYLYKKKKEETGQVKKRRDRSTKLAIAIEQYAVVMSLKKGTKI